MGLKICNKCRKEKELSQFNKYTKSRDGHFSWCRECISETQKTKYKQNPNYWLDRTKIWVESNPERSNAIKRKWVKNNREQDTRAKRRWSLENPEKDRACKITWSIDNRDKCNANLAGYRASKLQATPSWADNELMQLVYIEAKHRGLHVDHIAPLQGENVCGLHVYYNTQLLTRSENAAKGNQWPYSSGVPL